MTLLVLISYAVAGVALVKWQERRTDREEVR